MKLIRVETKGFKSFADRTALNFDGGIVGIVGPNGSGKSNINDAIKWVLGESAPKSLRSDKMDDVIFQGSKTVKALDTAEVTLTFDNTEGRSSVPHKKFTISRIIKRGEGSNTYLINGEKANKKDIQEIAMESGISKSSLAIISQGTISNIAQATPEERRGIFEEAAGISKYKSRKKKALAHLERTNQGLEKVKAVIRELEKQLNPLKRQAEKAKTYLKTYGQMKNIEIGLIVEDVKFFGEKLETLKVELQDFHNTKDDFNERIDSAETVIRVKTNAKSKLENEIQDIASKLEGINEKLHDVEMANMKQSQIRQMMLDGRMQATDEQKTEALKQDIEILNSKLVAYAEELDKLSTETTNRTEYLDEKETERNSKKIEIDRYKHMITKNNAKLELLIENRDRKTNLFQGSRTLMENKNLFKGMHGMVAELIDVEDGFASAIEGILQSALQHIVVDKSETAVKAVNFLKENRAGRATIIPLSSINPKGLREEHRMAIEGHAGFIGVASDFVNVDSKFEILKKFLLGNIILAEDIESANLISKLLQKRYMIVTKDGDIVRIGGIFTGGSKATSKNLLGSADKIAKLESANQTLKTEVERLSNEKVELDTLVAQERSLLNQNNISLAALQEKKRSTKIKFEEQKEKYESSSKEKLELETSLVESDSEELLQSEKASLIALSKAKRSVLSDINTDLARAQTEKLEIEKSLREIIESSSEKTTEYNQAEYMVEQAQSRLSSEYEMTLDNAKSQYSLSMEHEAARDKVNELKAEIRELGNVNIDSIAAYEEISERHDKYSAAEEELDNAHRTILSAIDEMDQIIISRLDNTVKEVNKEMDVIFKTMFGGGHAEVKYTNPQNLLETGIQVIAQPPGKTVKSLKLFSGGEKAMVAITLLFAILKSKPLPLCLLDEVEAALDDANVVRYAEYLKELKDKTQFIVVTHRAGTMSRVDHLFGATMQNRGVTSFFSVNLKEAKELIVNE